MPSPGPLSPIEWNEDEELAKAPVPAADPDQDPVVTH